MAHGEEHAQVTVIPPNKEKIKKLWTVAAILGVVTAFEFLIAFTMTSWTFEDIDIHRTYNRESCLHRRRVYALALRSQGVVLVDTDSNDLCGLDACCICL